MSDTELGSLFPDAAPARSEDRAYRVLARKYRPSTFAELIGQDALVRTLTNAFAQNRIAHAFMLTGVRGVGKTTTARIIARALNCIGPDGAGGPTITPCGTCANCTAIAADRHVDVMEMDAASRTGIDDIRELIEGVRYAPTSARYKIYIVDEVHMLSKAAFNALLKTLEEPPPHVKFIFATTEIRKVPVTVLSRCQRFDLRRIDAALLVEHFGRIAAAEGVAIEPEALSLVARAADGSARDGLSILDQAIALGDGKVTAVQVRDMLGLADRAIVIDLFEAAMGGKPADALDILSKLHAVGSDPASILEDLLEFTHFLTRIKLAPGAAGGGAAELELKRGAALVEKLSMPILTRTWQLLLKGLSELQIAPDPHAAAEMVVLRLAYAADLPSPGDLVRQLRSAPTNGATRSPAPRTADQPMTQTTQSGALGLARAVPDAAPASMQALLPQTAPTAEALPDPQSFPELVKLFARKREGLLEYHLASSVRLVRFEPGIVEFSPLPSAPPNLANRVGSLLSAWTARRWVVGISSAPGQPTLAEIEEAHRVAAFDQAKANPTVRALLEAFPGAVITEVRDLAQAPSAPPEQLDEAGDAAYPSDASEILLETGDEP
ncbi:MAG TPA: DNA polymerase III subunit gamma/tau [Alphaproteobacteria bacterium]|nr:DNA polymerase III subunit gamma/tau [Alphaproteobacteria bacterium]